MSNYSEVGLLPSGAQMGRLIDAVEAIANGSGGSQIKSSIEYGIRFALGEDGKLASTPAGERVIRYNGAITTWDATFTPNVGDGTAVTEYSENPFDLIPIFTPPLWQDGAGNLFRRWSPYYIGEQKMGGYLYKWVCESPLYSFYRMPEMFKRTINGITYKGYADIGVYEGSDMVINDVTYLASVPNQFPSHNHNRPTFYNEAQAWQTYLNVDTDEEWYGITLCSEFTEHWDYIVPIQLGSLNSQNTTTGFVGSSQFNWTWIYEQGMPVAAYNEDTMTVYFTDNQLATYRVGAVVSINNQQNSSYYFKIIANGSATGTVSGTTFTPDDSGETYYYVQLDGTSFPAVPTGIYIRPLMTGETDVIDATNGTLSNNGLYSFKLSGVENIWGNTNKQILDISLYNGTPYQLKDPHNFIEFSTATYTQYYNAANYEVANTSGYITVMGHDDALPSVVLPIAVGGSTTTYYCDYFWVNTSGAMTAYFGGRLSDYSNGGVFCRGLNGGVGSSDFYRCARLFHWEKIAPLEGD